jgi:hypothetical protein
VALTFGEGFLALGLVWVGVFISMGTSFVRMLNAKFGVP